MDLAVVLCTLRKYGSDKLDSPDSRNLNNMVELNMQRNDDSDRFDL